MEWHESTKEKRHFPRAPRWPWVAVLAAIAGGVLVVTWSLPDPPNPISDLTEVVPPEEPAQEAPPMAEPDPPPPTTEETDALVRGLVGDLFPLAKVGARDLVRRFVSAVNQIADGKSPRAPLAFWAPEGNFRARERVGRLVVDPRSYRRYDAIAEMLGALEVTRVAAIYGDLEPVFEHTHEELGARDRSFRETLALAIDHLAQTPVPEGPVRLRRDRIFFAFADEDLDRLSGAQKQLLRMGPRNARVVQSRLHEIATALALPPVRQHASR